MTFLAYAIATLLGLWFSYMGLVFALIVGGKTAYITGALLVVAYIGAIYFVVRQAKKGKGRQFAFMLALPMVFVTLTEQVFLLGQYGLSMLVPDSAEFEAACQRVGANYLRQPSSPVRSIVYDWDGHIAPPFNRFDLQFGSRISSLGYSDLPYPDGIDFTERRGSKKPGWPVTRYNGPFVRFPKPGERYGISDPTADVLVYYRFSPEAELDKAPTNQGIVRYSLAVTDRRTGDLLATLDYVIDAKNRRGCGVSSEGEMNERSFVLKAIGLK